MAALVGLVIVEGAEVSAGFVFVSGLGATDVGFEGAVGVAGGATALLASSSQSITSSGTAGVAGAGFVVVVDLGAEATEAALEVDELRFRSASCRRAIRSAFLPVWGRDRAFSSSSSSAFFFLL